jgi:hypothetical protein
VKISRGHLAREENLNGDMKDYLSCDDLASFIPAQESVTWLSEQ